MTRLIFILCCAAVMPGRAATIPAASGTQSDVQSAVNSAARGDTVTVPADDETWTTALTITKGIRLIGSGIGSTIIRKNSAMIEATPDATAIANEEPIEIRGFTFDGNATAANLVVVTGAGASDSKPYRWIIIGLNKFQNAAPVVTNSGAINIRGQVRGVIYSNQFDRCNIAGKIMGNNSTTEWSSSSFPFAFGGSDNLFIEGNTNYWSSSHGGDNPGWWEFGQGARGVFRYNGMNVAATEDQDEWWDFHGFQNFPGGQTGTKIWEAYGNFAEGCNGYALLNHRGSWGLAINNITTGANGMDIDLTQYDCTSDVPGATGVYHVEATNTYVINNTHNGTVKNMQINGAAVCGIAENTNFFNYASAYDGTVGIGRGTSLPGSASAVGVGYLVGATTTPTTDSAIVQTLKLYKWTGSSWELVWEPYTFPHPLYAAAAGGGDIPAAPGARSLPLKLTR